MSSHPTTDIIPIDMTTIDNSQYLHLIPPQDQLGHFINNQIINNNNNNNHSRFIHVISPNNEQLLCRVPCGTVNDVNMAVQAAHDAFYPDNNNNNHHTSNNNDNNDISSSWKHMSVPHRRQLLIQFVQLWKEHSRELALLESLNNGSSINTQSYIVNDLEKEMWYHIGQMDKLGGSLAVSLSDQASDEYHVFNRLEPIGVCGIIVPWNLPLWCLMVKVLPALCCGNTLVVKPSECTPLTALFVAKLFKLAGFPPGVFNVVNGYGADVGQALSSHPLVRKIAFTGSTLVGRHIMKSAADSNLKKIQLELGGKSPVVVFPDVNVKEAVKIALFAIFNNNGQLCTAGSRCFVHEAIYDEFVKEAAIQVNQMTIGSQMDPNTTIGPLINKTQFDKVLKYIQTGIQEGGKMICGSTQRARPVGYFVQPTIFTDLSHETSTLAREEIFGPVLCVFKFSDKEEVIRRANDSEYGLASAVITKNINLALEMSYRLEAGSVWINHYHNTQANTTFGGYKQSGIGREGGEEGIKAWTNSKSVFIPKMSSAL